MSKDVNLSPWFNEELPLVQNSSFHCHQPYHPFEPFPSKPCTHFNEHVFLGMEAPMESNEHLVVESDSDSSADVVDNEVRDDQKLIVDVDGLLYDEGARMKLELLAALVGVDSAEPEVVLAEVVRVLKHLKRIHEN